MVDVDAIARANNHRIAVEIPVQVAVLFVVAGAAAVLLPALRHHGPNAATAVQTRRSQRYRRGSRWGSRFAVVVLLRGRASVFLPGPDPIVARRRVVRGGGLWTHCFVYELRVDLRTSVTIIIVCPFRSTVRVFRLFAVVSE